MDPMSKFPINNLCRSVMTPSISDAPMGDELGTNVSLNKRILLKMVQGITYGAAGIPKTAAAMAVVSDVRRRERDSYHWRQSSDSQG